MQVQVLETTYGPCPVCGTAGGNCRGDSSFSGVAHIQPPRKNDPNATFTVAERIFTEEYVGSRKVRRLLHAKGDRITPEEAKQLGLIP